MNATRREEGSSELRRRIFQIERLGAMPQVVWRLVEALGDENTTPARLEKLIENDPGLASKVLALANSAYYGLSQKVTTISRAIVVMGFQELQLLAVGAGLASVFDLSKMPPEIDGHGLWLHCLAVSWTARELAEETGYPLPSEIMVAGLLHDLGKLVLVTHMQDDYLRLLKLNQDGIPYFKAEEALGIKHTQIGMWLAKRWGLPPIHEAAIQGHHTPNELDPYFKSTGLIFLADHIVKDLSYGLVNASRPVSAIPVINGLGLYQERLDTLISKVKNQVPAMLDTWGQILNNRGI